MSEHSKFNAIREGLRDLEKKCENKARAAFSTRESIYYQGYAEGVRHSREYVADVALS